MAPVKSCLILFFFFFLSYFWWNAREGGMHITVLLCYLHMDDPLARYLVEEKSGVEKIL